MSIEEDILKAKEQAIAKEKRSKEFYEWEAEKKRQLEVFEKDRGYTILIDTPPYLKELIEYIKPKLSYDCPKKTLSLGNIVYVRKANNYEADTFSHDVLIENHKAIMSGGSDGSDYFIDEYYYLYIFKDGRVASSVTTEYCDTEYCDTVYAGGREGYRMPIGTGEYTACRFIEKYCEIYELDITGKLKSSKNLESYKEFLRNKIIDDFVRRDRDKSYKPHIEEEISLKKSLESKKRAEEKVSSYKAKHPENTGGFDIEQLIPISISLIFIVFFVGVLFHSLWEVLPVIGFLIIVIVVVLVLVLLL